MFCRYGVLRQCKDILSYQGVCRLSTLPIQSARGRPKKHREPDNDAKGEETDDLGQSLPSRRIPVDNSGLNIDNEVELNTGVEIIEPDEEVENRSAPRRPVIPRLSLLRASRNHSDLTSFLDYASRSSLSLESTTFKGTHYEYSVAHTLKSYGFDLHRTGKANDLGIDLIGLWHLPQELPELRVLIQCKSSKPMPSLVRELEGAYLGAPAGWRGESVMAFLVTTQPATPGVRDALQRSRLPMGFAQVTAAGDLSQLLWNHAAGETRLTGLSVTNIYRRSPDNRKGTGEVKSGISLHWMGQPWRRNGLHEV